MPWKWYDGIIEKVETFNSTTKSFWVKTEEQIDFKAGQFVTMDLPISDKRLKRWRSYSIANIPNQDRLLEFCIVKLEGGPGTTYLFEEAKIGSSLRFKGPSGTFVLPPVLDHPMVMICTGTGVAPFRSMLLKLIEDNIDFPPIHLIFGTRYKEGILYRNEFEKLAKEQPNFSYDIALSREEDWDGYRGHVHQIYMENFHIMPDDTQFYLCGWTAMIDEAVANLLLKMKVDKSRIHYELYG